ncbi:MAG TPA: alpha-ketoglutarate-dependent dioxygenase AlkB [Marmoricola sp.]|jgi:alkylated DNA repair dioxygenase AlkB|nr:alpha-ketoglutarate-dependent dioxygenase AlkB [Marmoricola sp.]
MGVAFQPSLFDQPEPQLRPLDGLRRTPLTAGAWVDVLPGWLEGADELFARLVTAIPWRAESREMYDRVVDVPRLVHTYDVGEELPDDVLRQARGALSRHYAAELGEEFATAGCCYYRDGSDSVAWHGDTGVNGRGGRGRTHDTMVAILSLGSPRKLLLRPRGGTTAVSHALGHGDLIVMGGSCQRTWEHAVPKTSRPVGPRISVQFRPVNVF